MRSFFTSAGLNWIVPLSGTSTVAKWLVNFPAAVIETVTRSARYLLDPEGPVTSPSSCRAGDPRPSPWHRRPAFAIRADGLAQILAHDRLTG